MILSLFQQLKADRHQYALWMDSLYRSDMLAKDIMWAMFAMSTVGLLWSVVFPAREQNKPDEITTDIEICLRKNEEIEYSVMDDEKVSLLDD